MMLILSGFLFFVTTTRKIPNRLLGVLLLLIAFDLSSFFIQRWFDANLTINIFKTASSLIQMPLFYLYVLSACYSDFRFKTKHLLHAIPFLFFLILFKATSLSGKELLLFEIVGELQWFVYMIGVFIILKRRKNIYQENYSQPSSKIYNWLFQFAVISCIGHSFVTLRWIMSFLDWGIDNININIVISISTLSIITWFVFKALFHPIIFTGIKSTQKPIKSRNLTKTPNSNSEKLEKEAERLQLFMIEEKPYLDFELTLQKLATQIGIPEKELSLVINHHLGKHFFDFINKYRIEAATNILANPDEKDQTILEILYQVGFNSKSSFYTAFKKITGKTPTRYRREHLPN